MAKSSQMESQLLQYLEEHVLECSICVDKFKEPKNLPCQHTFCKDCIGEYINKTEKRGMFACPICRKEHDVPKGGATAFPGSIVIHSIIEAASLFRNNDIFCTSCVQNKRAVIACYSCGDFLCTECCQLHSNLRAKQKHATCTLDELKVSGNLAKFQKARFNICDDHGEMKKLYCNVHKQDICTMCSYEEDHRHHTKDICTLVTKVNQLKEDIQDQMAKMKTLGRKIIREKSGIDNDITNAQRIYNEDIRGLEDSAKFAIDMINQEKNSLKSRITQSHANFKSSLFRKERELTNAELTINMAMRHGNILSEIPLSSAVAAAMEIKKMVASISDDTKTEAHTETVRNSTRYVAPQFHRAINKSLKAMLVGNLITKEDADEEPFVLFSNLLPDGLPKIVKAMFSKGTEKHTMSYETYGRLSLEIAGNLEKTFNDAKWLCTVGAAECFNSSVVASDKDTLFPFLFCRWNCMHITVIGIPKKEVPKA